MAFYFTPKSHPFPYTIFKQYFKNNVSNEPAEYNEDVDHAENYWCRKR